MSLMIHPRIALYAQFAAVSMKEGLANEETTPQQIAENSWEDAKVMMAEMPGDLKTELAKDIMAYETVRDGILDQEREAHHDD